MADRAPVCVFVGEALAAYGFGEGHPFSRQRMDAFWDALQRSAPMDQLCIMPPAVADQDRIETFHAHAYVERVKAQSQTGYGYLDAGDTPAFPGIYEAAATVVGTSMAAMQAVLDGVCSRAFVPIAGLHHARRDAAAGFCVFNDCGVVIESLLATPGITSVVYVDIDAHHGDGVFYEFEDEPRLFFADMHEDGRYLYPGTGAAEEIGRGRATGTKLNVPMPPEADDAAFLAAWPAVEALVKQAEPDFILLQCGADSVAGDPITHLRYSAAAHTHAARRLCALADQYCRGRLLALGGGGYSLGNIATAWVAVVQALAAKT